MQTEPAQKIKISKEQQQKELILSMQLLPNKFQHNYDSPQEVLAKAKKMSSIDSERAKRILFNPIFRRFWKQTIELWARDPQLKHLNTFESSKQALRKNSNYIFTKAWKNLNFDYENYKETPNYMINAMICIGIVAMSSGTKVGVHFGLYTKTLLSLGTKKHEKWIRRAFDLADYGCFMLTELGHGSNVQGILTTAIYSHSDKTFILNTPLDQGMKFWIGNLAETGNMGVVFANLIMNGINEGVHAFLVEIRGDDGLVLPGLIIGDCGKKMGNNGVDNGWAMFRSMKVPLDALLNRFSWIDEKGKFNSKIKSKTRRFAVQISALSGGRLGVAISSAIETLRGCGIALRYSTVRKQFGEKKGMENVLMDYPLVHSKLVSRMSMSMVYLQAANLLDFESNNIDGFNLGDVRVKEMHSLSSFIKVASSWNLKKALSIARELCGGHGYSAYSHLPTLINDTEIHSTWEGTNEVILQQTCKNLLEEFNKFRTKGKIEYKTLQFLPDFDNDKIDIQRSVARVKDLACQLNTGQLSDLIKEAENPNNKLSFEDSKAASKILNEVTGDFLNLLRLRLYCMVNKCLGKFSQFLSQVKSTQNNFFRSFNKTLPFVLFPTATFFGELFCFSSFKTHLDCIGDTTISPVLFKQKADLGKLSQDEFINEKLFFQKVLIVFACSTLSQSSQFIGDAHESIDYQFFGALNNIVLKLSQSMRYDILSNNCLYWYKYIFR